MKVLSLVLFCQMGESGVVPGLVLGITFNGGIAIPHRLV